MAMFVPLFPVQFRQHFCIDFCQPINILDSDMLVNFMHGLANQAKFCDRTNLADKPGTDVPPVVDRLGFLLVRRVIACCILVVSSPGSVTNGVALEAKSA